MSKVKLSPAAARAARMRGADNIVATITSATTARNAAARIERDEVGHYLDTANAREIMRLMSNRHGVCG